jgi:hypothetical protein
MDGFKSLVHANIFDNDLACIAMDKPRAPSFVLSSMTFPQVLWPCEVQPTLF